MGEDDRRVWPGQSKGCAGSDCQSRTCFDVVMKLRLRNVPKKGFGSQASVPKASSKEVTNGRHDGRNPLRRVLLYRFDLPLGKLAELGF